MSTSDSIKTYVLALQGISYADWEKVKIAIDRTFDSKVREFRRNLELSDPDMTERLIRSQFGLDDIKREGGKSAFS